MKILAWIVLCVLLLIPPILATINEIENDGEEQGFIMTICYVITFFEVIAVVLSLLSWAVYTITH